MVKLLLKSCCDELLRFQHDNEIRSRYNTIYPIEYLDYLDIGTKYNLADLDFSTAPENDVYSSIDLYDRLIDLDRVQANDRRLWVGLTHNEYYDYTIKRWNIDNNTSNKVILRRFHFEGSSLETRMRNSISRLWWAAEITYDENRQDPYELTKVLWSKQQLQQSIVERSYGTYNSVVQGILEVYLDNDELSDMDIKILAKGLNSYGGVKILANMHINEVKAKLYDIAKYSGIQIKRKKSILIGS